MRLAVALLAVCLLPVASCLAPPPASQRATDAARELNLAARFGRMDLAVGRTAPGAREQFIERRAQWGHSLRILDIELAGLSMNESTRALVYVDVAWVRMNEDELRSTRLAQTWHEQDHGWLLVREQRVSGDLGLFGEHVTVVQRPLVDVHFPSRTIR